MSKGQEGRHALLFLVYLEFLSEEKPGGGLALNTANPGGNLVNEALSFSAIVNLGIGLSAN